MSSPQDQSGVGSMELLSVKQEVTSDDEGSGGLLADVAETTSSPSCSNGILKRLPAPPTANNSSPSLTHHAPSIVKRSRVSIIREPAAPPPAPKIYTKLVRWLPIRTELDWSTIKELPTPRMGHRAVMFRSKLIIFGGGNQKIHHELLVFDTISRTWSKPEEKGEDIPQGRASYGMEILGNYIYIFGGMLEHGVYTDELYRLEVASWTWEKLEPDGPTPCPRFGHSFTRLNDSFYIFGGLSNDTETCLSMPRYLGDLYKLNVSKDLKEHAWETPPIFGSVPSPRESHSAVAFATSTLRYNRLILYGGMCGLRLSDLYFLDVDTLMWTKPTVRGIPPAPRSMHSANLVGNKMYIFGGWRPVSEHTDTSEKLPREVSRVWKVSSELHCLNLESMTWEQVAQREKPGELTFWPKPRAGHCSAAGRTKIFIWGGKDGFNVDENGRNVCCSEMLELEVETPGAPGKVGLLDADSKSLSVMWTPVEGAESYLLQCCPYEIPAHMRTPMRVSRPAQGMTRHVVASPRPLPPPAAVIQQQSRDVPFTPVKIKTEPQDDVVDVKPQLPIIVQPPQIIPQLPPARLYPQANVMPLFVSGGNRIIPGLQQYRLQNGQIVTLQPSSQPQRFQVITRPPRAGQIVQQQQVHSSVPINFFRNPHQHQQLSSRQVYLTNSTQANSRRVFFLPQPQSGVAVPAGRPTLVPVSVMQQQRAVTFYRTVTRVNPQNGIAASRPIGQVRFRVAGPTNGAAALRAPTPVQLVQVKQEPVDQP